MWGFVDPDTVRALYQGGSGAAEPDVVTDSELPPPTTSGTVVVSVGGVYQSGAINGTDNEIAVSQVGATLTVSFASGFFLKGYNSAPAIRGRIGLGGLAVLSPAAASADTAGAPGAAYAQAEVAAILAELRDLKIKLRDAQILAT